MELISVIVPVYNVEQYLLRCVDSIRKQTYHNLEIILIDDGSPDQCPQLCETIRQTDARVKVVHKENGGLGFARNSGLDVATGTYVTFVDSDDWISEEHVENLYRAAREAQADAVIGSHTGVSAKGTEEIHPIRMPQKLYEGSVIIEEIVLPLIGADADYPQDVRLNSSSCMNLYRMEVIRANHLRFRSEKVAVAEDMYFNIDFFCHANRITAVNETGYYYFENTASISRKYDPKRFDRTVNFYRTIQQQLAQYGLEDRVSHRAERSFLMKIRVAIRHIVLSDLPRRQKIQEIRQILNHDLVKEVLGRYPVEAYIPAMRTLTKAMRRGDAGFVYWLIQFREFAKGTTWLKAMLKKIGIGN